MSAASSSSMSVAMPCGSGDSADFRGVSGVGEKWLRRPRLLLFPKRANWQHVCDCEKVGDAVLVQNSDPRLPLALLSPFQLP